MLIVRTSIDILIVTVSQMLDERAHSKAAGSGTCIALVVMLVPGAPVTIRRRLDIIVCNPRCYATAITGWTGSTTLERDLRRYTSKVKGWRFDSTGISDEITGQMIEDATILWQPGIDIEELERSLFTFLGLDWIPPTFRCA